MLSRLHQFRMIVARVATVVPVSSWLSRYPQPTGQLRWGQDSEKVVSSAVDVISIDNTLPFHKGVVADFSGSTCFIGSGNMVRALVDGIVKGDSERAADMLVIGHSDAAKLLHFCDLGVAATLESPSMLPSTTSARTFVLGCKPGQVKEAIKTLPLREGDHVVSLAAGVPIGKMEAWIGRTGIAVTRVMPNTPAAVGKGAAGIFHNAHVTPKQRASAHQLIETGGMCVGLAEEAHMHAVTATSGSGPAYYFEAMHHMAQAITRYTLAYSESCDLVFSLFERAVSSARDLGEKRAVEAIETACNPIVAGMDAMMCAAHSKSQFLAGKTASDPADNAALSKLPDISGHGDRIRMEGLEAIALSMIVGQYLSAQKLGLPSEQAWGLVLKTAQGAVALARIRAEEGVSLDTLADDVTSPNGTTDAARETANTMGVWQAMKSMVHAVPDHGCTLRR